MPLAFAMTSPLARRSRLAGARLLAHAIAGLLLVAHGARAESLMQPAASRVVSPATVLVCSDHNTTARDSRPPIELVMKDGQLIELPLGSPRYRLLTENEFAIIAVDDYAGFEPVLGMVNIFAAMMTIDKTTGNFAMTTIVSDKVLAPRTGRCRMFEQQAGTEKVLAQRR
jgi:hypothetical protein